MTSSQRVLACLIIVILLLASLSIAQSRDVQDVQAARQVVDDVLSLMEDRQVTWTEARKRISSLPENSIVQSLIQVLDQKGGITNEEIRIFSYTMLVERNAANTDSGYEQLTNGLTDPAVSDICVKGLLKAPKEKQEEVLEHVKTFLKNTIRLPKGKIGPGMVGVINILPREGPLAPAYVDILQDILHDSRRDEQVRWAAARAVLQIRGLTNALKQHQNIDPVGAKVTIWTLTRFIGEADERLGFELQPKFSEQLDRGYREARAKAQQYALDHLKSSDHETRLAAFQMLCMSFGRDWVVFHTDEDYEWNPVLRTAMEKMAANESDSQLREAAEHHLNFSLDKAAAKLLRLKRRHQEQQK